MLKRTFDLIVSLVALIVLSPLLAIIAALVKLDSPGPAFYRAERIGRGGRPFRMYKFRTMIVGADRVGPAITCRDDPRITRLGRLLRRTKLDELPQFLNVLRGEMSLVGPRPEAPRYVALYSPQQREVLKARPGITGLAQLAYIHEEELLNPANLDRDYVRVLLPRKLALDLEYVNGQSFLLDLKILLWTALALAGGRPGELQPRLAPDLTTETSVRA